MTTVSKIGSRSTKEIVPIIEAQVQMWMAGQCVAVPYLVGDPGMGKSAMLYDMTARLGWNMLHTHYGLTPVEEVSGMPDFKDIALTINNETVNYPGTMWRLPDIMTKLYDIAALGKPVLWVLDDYHLSSAYMMQLSYELFSQFTKVNAEGVGVRVPAKLRGYEIPLNVGFLLVGNGSAKAGAKASFSAVNNRISWYHAHLEFQSWKHDFALVNALNPKVISFLENESYAHYCRGEEKTDGPWPSFRSWTHFAKMLSVLEYNQKANHSDVLYLAAAHVGDTAASDFAEYYSIFSEIDAEGIFTNKVHVQIPSSMMDRYVYMIACTVEFINRTLKSKKMNPAANQKYTEIVSKMVAVSSEIAVTGLKEVAFAEKNHKIKGLFHNILSGLVSFPGNVKEQLLKDISAV